MTYNCVKSIAEHGAEVAFEIIIVDDCSRDETMFAAFAFGSGIRFIRNPENCGFIRSCNRGFAAARGEYIVFLNNDTEVKARWLDELYETMQRDPEIGIVGAKLLYPDGSLQECGGIIWRLGDRVELGPRSDGRRSAVLLHARCRLRVRRRADDQSESVRGARKVRRALSADVLRRYRAVLPRARKGTSRCRSAGFRDRPFRRRDRRNRTTGTG